MEIYDQFAAKIEADYQLFLMGLAGRYQQTVAAGIQVTPSSIKELIRDANIAGNAFIDLMEAEVNNYIHQICPNQSMLEELAAERKQAFILQMQKAVSENIAQVAKMLRTGSNDYKKMLKNLHGSLCLLLQKKVGVIEFKIYDTANRKWDAAKLVKFVARDFAYQLWVDLTIAIVEKANAKEITVLHPMTGKIVSFSISDLSEIRKSVFHPNSSAKVVINV